MVEMVLFLIFFLPVVLLDAPIYTSFGIGELARLAIG